MTPEEFKAKALELKESNSTAEITTSDDAPYNIIVGRITKLDDHYITLEKIPVSSDGKFPDTYTGIEFSLDYSRPVRNIDIKMYRK